ncbi:DUF3072 domain-containing protein [Hansschlegelia zhihuaiae]|uniref:DUF3072 domain-containing protein n=1 Tax=Hansschlegelia zhihuaiae TaxID=405005 RepID=A0A4Q0MKM9_9HYPH|nr:DUF3072 domain-containing protein [Hansschlegelia zhihuaiae]RXF73576.1 DUF3072 domain-containing protein [Hansschlegelia zhihuaiae]
MSDDNTPSSRVDARRETDPDAPTPGKPAQDVHPNPKTAPDPESNADKDPADWVSGDEPMTGAQASYLKTLSEETGADAYRDDLSKAEASTLIDELKNARNEKR